MDEGLEKTSKAIEFIDFLDTLKSCGFSYVVQFVYENRNVDENKNFPFDDFVCEIEIFEPEAVGGSISTSGEGVNILDAFDSLKSNSGDFLKEYDKKLKIKINRLNKENQELSRLYKMVQKSFKNKEL